MPAPTVSGVTAEIDASGNITIVATFSENVAITDESNIVVHNAALDSSSAILAEITFTARGISEGDVVTMDFLDGNTIESVSDATPMAEDLDVEVTNNVVSSVPKLDAGAMQDSAAIHTAALVLAEETRKACREAC